MNIRDIDTKLDMKLKLIIEDQTEIFRWSKLHNIDMSLYVREDSDNPGNFYFEAFIMKNPKNAGASQLIEAYSPLETESFYMISRPIINKKILTLMQELWVIPSIKFSETTIENGKLIIRLLFHSQYKKDISLVLNKYMAIPYFIDDMLLIESEGNIFLMNKKNSRQALSVIQYSLPISIHTIDYASRVLAENKGLGVVAENPFKNNEFKVIVFLEDHVDESANFKCLSEKDNIYEAITSNELLNEILKEANSQGMFRNQITISIKNDRIYSTSVISSKRIMEYIKIIFSSSYKLYKKNHIIIENCFDFNPELYAEL